MINTLLELLQYSFIQRALIAGIFLGLLCAILGVFLVLRRLSLIGDGLAHVSFGALALGLAFGVYPFGVAVPLVIVAAIAIQLMIRYTSVDGDAAIGIISATGISTGIILASVSGGFNIDIYSFLFGNILAISSLELYLAIGLSGIVLSTIAVSYHELVYVTFDEEQAQISGINTTVIQTLISILTAITIVLSVKMVGIMLVSSLLIIPASSALQISSGFGETLRRASLLSITSVIFGIIIAFVLDVPPGATIVLTNIGFFATILGIRLISDS
mgnify:FL=1